MDNTTFLLNGGAGRVITSIPALEKYAKLNPQDDFKILVNGWEQLFWSNSILQSRVFGAHQKGNFENFIKKNKVVSPEPYFLKSFYNQKTNLVEAFDECINNTNDHSDLNYSCLYLSSLEQRGVKEFVSNLKKEHNKKKLVVMQPFGSAVEIINHQPVDRSNRSLLQEQYFEIVKSIHNDAVVIYTSLPQFKHPQDNITISIDEFHPYLRTMIGLIYECDLFVGVCSVGQHIARALNKNGIIIMGGTKEQNFSYPDFFKIFRKQDRSPSYVPWRVSDADCEFADRINDNLMNFNNDELKELINIIHQELTDNKNESNLIVDYSKSLTY